MQEVRCKKCGKLLYKTKRDGSSEVEEDIEHMAIKDDWPFGFAIECKCPRCGEMNTKKESVESEQTNRTNNCKS